MSRLRPIAVLFLAGLLGACSILPKSEVLSFYRLPASALPAHNASPRSDWALRVNKPYSNQLLDSTRIAVLHRAIRSAPTRACAGATAHHCCCVIG